MQTGISAASLYPLETEKALLHLSALGFSLFEIFLNAFEEATPAFSKTLNALQKAHGLRIRSVHPFTSALESMLLFENYTRRTEEGMELYRRFCETAAAIGATVLVLHGQRQNTGSLSDEAYFERYARLYEIGRELGVFVAQENVYLFRSGSMDFICRMHEALGGQCAFVLDTKQARLSGEDALSMCDAMGDRIVQVHLSDADGTQTCLLPGEGRCDFLPLRSRLLHHGYTGSVLTEVYRGAIHGDAALKKSQIYTKNIFEA